MIKRMQNQKIKQQLKQMKNKKLKKKLKIKKKILFQGKRNKKLNNKRYLECLKINDFILSKINTKLNLFFI